MPQLRFPQVAYRAFLSDVTSAMLVSQTNPVVLNSVGKCKLTKVNRSCLGYLCFDLNVLVTTFYFLAGHKNT